MRTNGTSHEFGETNWSLVRELQEQDPDRRRRALESLVRTYQGPVYAYLRQLGCDHDRAADLTQGFFLEKVLRGGLFARADRSRARLRVLLRTALRHFRIDQYRRDATRGVDGAISRASLEYEEEIVPSQTGLSPEDAFQRRWACTVLDEALRRCREDYIRRGAPAKWEAFFARTVRPLMSGAAPVPHVDVAEEVGLKAPGEVAHAIQEVRRRLHMIVLEVVSETVGDSRLARDELRELLRTFSPGGS